MCIYYTEGVDVYKYDIIYIMWNTLNEKKK